MELTRNRLVRIERFFLRLCVDSEEREWRRRSHSDIAEFFGRYSRFDFEAMRMVGPDTTEQIFAFMTRYNVSFAERDATPEGLARRKIQRRKEAGGYYQLPRCPTCGTKVTPERLEGKGLDHVDRA